MIPLRILHLIGADPREQEAEGAALLAAWQRDDGHAVAVSGGTWPGCDAMPARQHGWSWIFGGRRAWEAALAGWTPDVLHVHGVDCLAPAIDLARRQSLPLVASLHRLGDQASARALRHPRIGWVLVPSEHHRSWVLSHAGVARDRIAILPFGVPTPRSRPASGGDSLEIGFAGPCDRRSGWPALLRCARRMRQRLPGLRLRLACASDDDARQALAEAKDAGVPAQADHDGVHRLAQRCDVLLHLADDHRPWLDVVACLAAGVPVVAAAHGAASELIHDGRTGLIIPPGDEEALEAALGQMTFPDHRRHLAIAALEDAAPRFKLDAVGEASIALYHSTIGTASPSSVRKAESGTIYRRITAKQQPQPHEGAS